GYDFARGWKFDVKSAHAFSARAGALTTVTVTASQAGNPILTPIEKRLRVAFQMAEGAAHCTTAPLHEPLRDEAFEARLRALGSGLHQLGFDAAAIRDGIAQVERLGWEALARGDHIRVLCVGDVVERASRLLERAASVRA